MYNNISPKQYTEVSFVVLAVHKVMLLWTFLSLWKIIFPNGVKY